MDFFNTGIAFFPLSLSLPGNALVLPGSCGFYDSRKAREDEKNASIRLNEMIANYGDVIPRRDFEALEKKYKVGNFRWISSCFCCCFVFDLFVLLLFVFYLCC